jgi:regulator of sigma E protease
MQTLYTIFMMMLLFGVTVFVHELGHYWVARRMGFVVDTFSIGFGPALLQWKRRGIRYKIGIIPFGGYVALPQLDPELGMKDKDASAESRDLPPIAPHRKIPVLLAGVTGNLILAFLIAVALFAIGGQQAFQSDGCVLGYVATNSPAYEAGLRIGDRIEAVNGEAVDSWDEFILSAALAETVTVRAVESGGGEKNITLATEPFEEGGGRVLSGIARQTPCFVIGVMEGSSAEEAGIRQKDVITHIDGTPIRSQDHLIELVQDYAGRSVSVTVERGEETLSLTVTPRYDAELDRALIGIQFNPFDIYKRPLEQMIAWAAPVFRILQALLTPSEASQAAGAVGGPVAIFGIFWMAIQSSFVLALWYTGMINVNLAILNILPIPVLDGGHILVSLIETVRRRPLPPKFVVVLHNMFAILLIGLMLLITARDVRRRFFRGGGEAPAAEAVEPGAAAGAREGN